MLTSYAIAYALLSPIGAALTGSLPRRTVLVAALGLFCVGSLLSALSTSLLMLTASRLLVAFGAALYTPLSAGVAVAVTPPEQRGWALAKVFGGMTMAQVAGVPLGAWLAYRFGWHAPFFLAAALAALCAAGAAAGDPAATAVSIRQCAAPIIGALGNARLMVSVTFTATLMAAVYVVFTYFAPLIEASAGSNPETRTLYLVLFGLGAMGGNFMGGYLSDRVGPLTDARPRLRGAYRAAAAVLDHAVAPGAAGADRVRCGAASPGASCRRSNRASRPSRPRRWRSPWPSMRR